MSEPIRLATMLAAASRFVVVDDDGERSRSSDATALEALRRACRIVERDGLRECLCNGDVSVLLFAGREMLGEIRNYHGETIQFSGGRGGNEDLVDAAAWRAWLATVGAPEVEEDWFNAQRDQRGFSELRASWLTHMPDALRPFWDEMLAAYERREVAPEPSALSAALTSAVPDLRTRITHLLRWFGAGHHTWLDFPTYEFHALNLLALCPVDEVAAVALESTDLWVVEGAARFFTMREKTPFQLAPELARKLSNRVERCRDADQRELALQVFRSGL